MYTINEIEKLLSKQARAALTANGNDLFDVYEPQAAQIVVNKANINPDDPPAWVMQPFVWILEYLLLNQFSGLSAETINMVSERYKEAIKILEEEHRDVINQDAATGTFNDLYRGEF